MALKPLGDGFIALVKMLIAPVVFCTVVLGITGAGNMKKAGRVGGKALLYFEVVSTLALIIGLMVMNFVRPGEGFNVDPKTLDAAAVIRDGLRALIARDRAVGNWLTQEIGPAYDALKADPARAVTVGQVRAMIAAEHKKATKKV